MADYYARYIDTLSRALHDIAVTDRSGRAMTAQEGLALLCDRTRKVKERGGSLFFCGNGASAAMASHMSVDWLKNAGVRSAAFNDVATLTAYGNDTGYENVFAGPLKTMGRPRDMLVAISSSGSSPSVLKALQTARELEMFNVTLTGFKADNPSRALGDLNFYLSSRTYGIAESGHQVVLHAWFDQFMNISEWT